ncbi:hypothetical protein BT93_A0617 [Corymbia citriodora subsp. variegata]|nr:hypothetical protein BT93_A0617 [Corymbia citriodora subsp. variegata]
MCQLNCATRRSNPHQTRGKSNKNAIPRNQNLEKAYLYDKAEEIRPAYEQEPDEEDDIEEEEEGAR